MPETVLNIIVRKELWQYNPGIHVLQGLQLIRCLVIPEEATLWKEKTCIVAYQITDGVNGSKNIHQFAFEKIQELQEKAETEKPRHPNLKIIGYYITEEE